MEQGLHSAKLAVILHADVAGSTMLVQSDESLAHDRITAAFTRFSKIIQAYHGKVHEIRGDALIAEFARASDAVCAVLEFQRQHGDYLEQLDDSIKPVIRAGVSLGEVVLADHTVTGVGVVLAQRVEQLANPGGLCITPAIREALPKRLPFELEDLGDRQIKGFEETVRVYRVTLQSGASVPAPPQNQLRGFNVRKQRFVAILLVMVALIVIAIVWIRPVSQLRDPPHLEIAAQALPDKPSIAVLPFINMSGDPQQDYFADGITEDLTTDLSRISGLFVVARNSSFAYRGRSVDVRVVSRELGVRYILEGSVRRVNNQIRINAQLVDGETGGHIWAERFDGTMADVFALQDHVNRKIVAALKISLTAADERSLDKVETTNAEAYDLLLRGLEQYQNFSRESMILSRDWFEQAAALDPDYARAYANIALTHSTEVNFYWTADREESIRLGLESADKALALDDSIPQIYLTRSSLYLSQRQHQAAIESALRMVETHPDYADGHATLAFILSYSAQPQKALQALARANQINPQSTGIYLGVEGRILFLLGRYEDALLVLEESVERNPAFDRTRLNLAATYAQLGRIDDAAWAVEEALAISPGITLEKERREALYMKASDLDHYINALRKAGVAE